MNNTQKRFLLFGLALPLLILAMLIPWGHHLLVNIMVVISTILGSDEMVKMMNRTGVKLPRRILPLLSGGIPVIVYLLGIDALPRSSLLFFITAAGIAILVIPIFSMGRMGFDRLLPTTGAALLCLFYPGFLLSYITRLSAFDHGSAILIILLLTVYLNDSNAWFVGVFFGKNSRRKIFAVSPNKSLIGFAGGIFASVVITSGSCILLPEIFNLPFWAALLLGLLAGITTILGDLVESGIKRSAGVKDSGTMIMGRGGLLDSIDSLLLTAPAFYWLLSLSTH